ncbi:MAG: hypothetical protein AB7S44_00710 [Spirochaetales bacterium]
MKKEIELKYLINHLPNSCNEHECITQYYFDPTKRASALMREFDDLNLATISEARIRMVRHGDAYKFYLTLKNSNPLSRDEYEKQVDVKLAKTLLKDNIVGKLSKNRYVIKERGYTFEFDEFLSLSQKLFLVEVELDSLPTATVVEEIESILSNTFDVKFKDVTKDKTYKNAALAKTNFGGLEK